jgi:dTDP-4-dehydrorhamnose 3,5-epimerase
LRPRHPPGLLYLTTKFAACHAARGSPYYTLLCQRIKLSKSMHTATSPSTIAATGSRQSAGGQIDGVTFKVLTTHSDQRGSFTEVFQQEWNTGLHPVQWSAVQSAAGSLRGMYVHRRHEEYFALLSGRAVVGLRDVRAGSATEGVASTFELDGRQLACLVFPRGLIHGWYFHEDSLHLQAVSESYGTYGQDDNYGCRWDDPELGISWPFTLPTLSARCAGLPSYRELLEQLASRQP